MQAWVVRSPMMTAHPTHVYELICTVYVYIHIYSICTYTCVQCIYLYVDTQYHTYVHVLCRMYMYRHMYSLYRCM